ncbi:porin family protein [Chondrinema litorale]|uniref:porin family protein n=1 Tax=Chondrinema litorale TaxID=2994555 RepID=UPI0025437CA2|nr:porin family protein [Chondrinema litorale]UZR99961.1 porin family protein [Chondrinema litorale]
MKTINIMMLVVCISITSNTNAQDNKRYHYNDYIDNSIGFGLKIGTNYSNVYSTEGEEFKSNPKFGLATGFFATIPIYRNLAIQPEILLSQKGFKATGKVFNETYELKRTTTYIDVPILLMLKPVEFLSLLVGPQYSYLIKQKNRFTNASTTIDQEEAFENDNIRKNTLCFIIGADINLNQVVIGTRVGWDLQKNNGDSSSSTPRYKNYWGQLTLGYKF